MHNFYRLPNNRIVFILLFAIQLLPLLHRPVFSEVVQGVSVGTNSLNQVTSGSNSVSIGQNASAIGTSALAIGSLAQANGLSALAIGFSAISLSNSFCDIYGKIELKQ